MRLSIATGQIDHRFRADWARLPCTLSNVIGYRKSLSGEAIQLFQQQRFTLFKACGSLGSAQTRGFSLWGFPGRVLLESITQFACKIPCSTFAEALPNYSGKLAQSRRNWRSNSSVLTLIFNGVCNNSKNNASFCVKDNLLFLPFPIRI